MSFVDGFRVQTDTYFFFVTKILLNFGNTKSLVLGKGGGGVMMTSPFCLYWR
jgi:hypothetical protein